MAPQPGFNNFTQSKDSSKTLYLADQGLSPSQIHAYMLICVSRDSSFCSDCSLVCSLTDSSIRRCVTDIFARKLFTSTLQHVGQNKCSCLRIHEARKRAHGFRLLNRLLAVQLRMGPR